MSEEAKPNWISRIRARFRFCVAALASIIVGVLLAVAAVVAWTVYSLDPMRLAWGDYMSWSRIAGVVVLWVLVMGITYVTVRLWLNDLPITDRSLRGGWDAGMHLLSRHGVDIADLPLFIVLGCTTRHQQDRWFGQHGLGTAHPSGSSPPIDWRLCDDHLLCFVRDLGIYSALIGNPAASPRTTADPCHADLEAASLEPNADPASGASTDDPEEEHAVDCQSTEGEALPSSLTNGGQHTSGTPDHTSTATLSTPNVKTAGTATSTKAIESLDRADQLLSEAQAFGNATTDASRMQRTVKAESIDSTVQSARQTDLIQFCQRLRTARSPHAAINGTLIMVPADALETCASETSASESSASAAHSIGRAIRNDLLLIRSHLCLSFPITVMVSEQDRVEGYQELMKRSECPEPHDSRALGKEFSAQQIPTAKAINELVDAAIGDVGRRIHATLRLRSSQMGHQQPETTDQEPKSMNQNHRLVRLAIRHRRWQQSLRGLMVEAVAADPDCPLGNVENETSIVSGLFFGSPPANSNDTSVRSVIDRMVSQQNFLSWTRSELEQRSRHLHFVNALKCIAVALVLVMLFQFYFLVLRGF